MSSAVSSGNASPISTENKSLSYVKRKLTYEYSGSVDVSSQLPHGVGLLKYPNGTIYEGCLNQGRRNDIGRLYKPRPKTTVNHHHHHQYKRNGGGRQVNEPDMEWEIVGKWINNQPSPHFPFKINFPGKFEYFGCVSLRAGSVDLVDSIEDFTKERQGELFLMDQNSMYFGEFKDDMRDGFGVQEFGTMDKYYGMFKSNQFHNNGTFYYKDGTIFQGNYYNGVRKGSGTLYFPNGDKLEGEWNGSEVKGKYIKGTVQNCSLSTLSMIKHEIDFCLRQREDFNYMVTRGGYNSENNNFNNNSMMMSMMASNGNQSNQATKSSEKAKPAYMSSKWYGFLIRREDVWKNEKAYFMSKYAQPLASIKKFKLIIEEMFHSWDRNTSQQAIQPLCDYFRSTFDGSFSIATMRDKVQASAKRKHNAISRANEDAQSFITFLNDLLWDFFNSSFQYLFTEECDLNETPKTQHQQKTGYFKNIKLPFYYYDEPKTETMVGVQNQDRSKYHCQQLLTEYVSEYVHQKIYGTLFPLYQITYQENDLFMAQKIEQLVDTQLQQLGVPIMFWPSHFEEQPYQTSIQLLKELPTKKTVKSKIEVLSNLRLTIMHELKHYRDEYRKQQAELNNEEYVLDNEWQPAADDVTGVYTYVFIRSNLQHYFAEYKYVNEWKDTSLELDPVSHIVTFFGGFLQFASDIHPNLKKPNGEFLSSFTLRESIKNSIVQELLEHQEEIIEPFYWLPSLLLFISLNIEPMNNKFSLDSELTILIPPTKKLYEELTKNLVVIQRTLARCKDIGFEVQYATSDPVSLSDVADALLLTDSGNINGAQLPNLIVHMHNVYPTHIYTELALRMKRYIQFELLFIE